MQTLGYHGKMCLKYVINVCICARVYLCLFKGKVVYFLKCVG